LCGIDDQDNDEVRAARQKYLRRTRRAQPRRVELAGPDLSEDNTHDATTNDDNQRGRRHDED
jgi:hypothetical protein